MDIIQTSQEVKKQSHWGTVYLTSIVYTVISLILASCSTPNTYTDCPYNRRTFIIQLPIDTRELIIFLEENLWKDKVHSILMRDYHEGSIERLSWIEILNSVLNELKIKHSTPVTIHSSQATPVDPDAEMIRFFQKNILPNLFLIYDTLEVPHEQNYSLEFIWGWWILKVSWVEANLNQYIGFTETYLHIWQKNQTSNR